jgi:hypothetical protein
VDVFPTANCTGSRNTTACTTAASAGQSLKCVCGG